MICYYESYSLLGVSKLGNFFLDHAILKLNAVNFSYFDLIAAHL